MINNGIERTQHYAQSYLNLYSDPIPRWRSLRDLLRIDPSSQDMQDAKRQVLTFTWVVELAAE
jgi:hypothetical protein